MAKCEYGRWAIINKEGHEFGNLGWFSNCDKADVLAYCKEKDIKIQEGEYIKVVEETEKFEGHLTPLREVENDEIKKQNEGRAKIATWQLKDANKDIDEFLNHIVDLSERLVHEIKTKQKYIEEIREGKSTTDATVLDYLDWSVNEVENMIRNINFNRAVRISNKYSSAKLIIDLLTDKEVI